GLDPGRVPGARQAQAPDTIKPLLATLAGEAPPGDDWLHEIKFDGYRLLAHVNGSQVRLISRNQLDWTHRFRKIAADLATLRAKPAILDGEAVALDEKGVSSFGALQQALSNGQTADLIYYAFDLLHLDGYDLRRCRLEDRKELLAGLIPGAPPRVRTAILDG